MTDEPEFLRRWSRRKQAARQGAADEPVEAEEQPAEHDPDAASDASEAADSPPADPEALDLPDIDSLTAESDFKPFLKEGVPKELKNRALRKLWRVNPVFGIRDGLNDYDGDFTDSATVVKGLKTLYKVGRGFLAEPKDEPAAADPEAAEAENSPASAEPIDDPEDAESEEAAEGGDGNKIT